MPCSIALSRLVISELIALTALGRRGGWPVITLTARCDLRGGVEGVGYPPRLGQTGLKIGHPVLGAEVAEVARRAGPDDGLACLAASFLGALMLVGIGLAAEGFPPSFFRAALGQMFLFDHRGAVFDAAPNGRLEADQASRSEGS
jgi:hypothetical protein